ncbi:MAG TPA: hypothetical protein VF070_01180 [Streptosporangiaceae bacterium]
MPVRLSVSSRVTHGLPLVPPVKSAHTNLSWCSLCWLVQFRQAIGALALDG